MKHLHKNVISALAVSVLALGATSASAKTFICPQNLHCDVATSGAITCTGAPEGWIAQEYNPSRKPITNTFILVAAYAQPKGSNLLQSAACIYNDTKNEGGAIRLFAPTRNVKADCTWGDACGEWRTDYDANYMRAWRGGVVPIEATQTVFYQKDA